MRLVVTKSEGSFRGGDPEELQRKKEEKQDELESSGELDLDKAFAEFISKAEGQFRGGDPEELEFKKQEKEREMKESGAAEEEEEAAAEEEELADPSVQEEAEAEEEEKKEEAEAEKGMKKAGVPPIGSQVSPVGTGDYVPKDTNQEPYDALTFRGTKQPWIEVGPARCGENQNKRWSEVLGLEPPRAPSGPPTAWQNLRDESMVERDTMPRPGPMPRGEVPVAKAFAELFKAAEEGVSANRIQQRMTNVTRPPGSARAKVPEGVTQAVKKIGPIKPVNLGRMQMKGKTFSDKTDHFGDINKEEGHQALRHVFGNETSDSEAGIGHHIDKAFQPENHENYSFKVDPKLQISHNRDDPRNHGVDVEGYIYPKKGQFGPKEHIGSYSRKFHRDEKGDLVAHHSILEVDKKHKGQGIASSLLKSSISHYPKLGVKKVTVDPEWDGRYAWARMGFDWGKNGTDHVKKTLPNFLMGKGMSSDQAYEASNNHAHKPWEVAALHVDGNHVGKEYLLGRDGNHAWDQGGEMELHHKNPGYKQLKRYLKMEEGE